VIRGVLDADSEGRQRIDLLRHHNTRLSALRDAVEAEAAREPAPEPLAPVFQQVPAELAEMPEATAHGRKAALRVTVARKWDAAEGIAGFELRPLAGTLPTFQPGAHIDVHLPNGEIRQYSITNAPSETDR